MSDTDLWRGDESRKYDEQMTVYLTHAEANHIANILLDHSRQPQAPGTHACALCQSLFRLIHGRMREAWPPAQEARDAK
jgi:hypothetical protein